MTRLVGAMLGLAAVAVSTRGLVIAQRLLLALGGTTLLAFAAYKVATRCRHPRWVGMRVGPRVLVSWAFLMASAHGAGVMVLPFVMTMPATLSAANHDHLSHMVPGGTTVAAASATAVAIHTFACLAVMTVAAFVVYRKLGLSLLRTAWFNLDWLWAGALVVTGMVVLFT